MQDVLDVDPELFSNIRLQLAWWGLQNVIVQTPSFVNAPAKKTNQSMEAFPFQQNAMQAVDFWSNGRRGCGCIEQQAHA